MEASRACRWRRIAAKRGQFPAVAMAAIFLGAVRPTFVLNRPFSRRSVLGVVGAGVAITEEPVFAESPDSLDSVLQFSNAVAASKAQKFRNFGLKPNIGLQVRKLDRKGKKSDGPVLRSCQEQVIPRCFSTTEDFFREKKIQTKLEPWKIPAGMSPEEATKQLTELIESYPPGHDGVDAGGFRLLQTLPTYLYGQFASFIGLISDVEFAVMENGDVQVRSALRSMAPDAFGNVQTPPDSLLNAKRLNWFSERLRKMGWAAPEITEQTHPEYFAENMKAGLKTVGLEFMPEREEDGKPEYW
ncbi:unnamed protein product [Symbiodinium microadriaticum]|nr:unnamed protein product [Symbiodinium sp. KB8]CAE7866205.1 unnamed protein product [Symbiodinium microadriaticum]